MVKLPPQRKPRPSSALGLSRDFARALVPYWYYKTDTRLPDYGRETYRGTHFARNWGLEYIALTAY